MSKRHRHWSSYAVGAATVASVAAAAVLIGGFIYGTYAALGDPLAGAAAHVSSPVAAVPSASLASSGASGVTGKGNKSQTIRIVGLGDSLAHGFGDSTGQGFVGDVSQAYRRRGDRVITTNLGINGLTSAGLVRELQQPSVQQAVPAASVIIVSIGGNDLNNAANLPNIRFRKIATAEASFETNLKRILVTLRGLNRSAPLVLIGLYNPYSNVTSQVRATDAIVQNWDLHEDIIADAFPHVVVVQTYDLFQLHPGQFLYLDHFHPNNIGYERIAERILQDLKS